MLKSYFLQFQKMPYLGLFRTRDGVCPNSVGETKDTGNNWSTGASAAFPICNGGIKRLNLILWKF